MSQISRFTFLSGFKSTRKVICGKLDAPRFHNKGKTLGCYITADLVSVCAKVKMEFIEFMGAVELWPVADAGLLNAAGRHRQLPGKTIPMCNV